MLSPHPPHCTLPCTQQVIGSISGSGRVVLVDREAKPGDPVPVDLDLEKVLGDMPNKTFRCGRRGRQKHKGASTSGSRHAGMQAGSSPHPGPQRGGVSVKRRGPAWEAAGTGLPAAARLRQLDHCRMQGAWSRPAAPTLLPPLQPSRSQIRRGCTPRLGAHHPAPPHTAHGAPRASATRGSHAQEQHESMPAVHRFDRSPRALQPLSIPSAPSAMEALDRVLRLPGVCSKRFLTTKVDRSVTGRDPLTLPCPLRLPPKPPPRLAGGLLTGAAASPACPALAGAGQAGVPTAALPMQ